MSVRQAEMCDETVESPSGQNRKNRKSYTWTIEEEQSLVAHLGGNESWILGPSKMP